GAAASRPESVLATDLRRLATGLRRLVRHCSQVD
ncbi:hypothetical protein A2U01_0055156, partial [Trifolium medium]|nr:hypothetical protein [Trifolium medium]